MFKITATINVYFKGMGVKFGTFIMYVWNQACLHLSEKILCRRVCTKTPTGEVGLSG